MSVRKTGKRDSKSAFGLIKSAYVEDKPFVDNFAQMTPEKGELARYILVKINDKMKRTERSAQEKVKLYVETQKNSSQGL